MQQDPTGVGVVIALDVLDALIAMAKPVNHGDAIYLCIASNAREGFTDRSSPYPFPYSRKAPTVTHRSCPR